MRTHRLTHPQCRPKALTRILRRHPTFEPPPCDGVDPAKGFGEIGVGFVLQAEDERRKNLGFGTPLDRRDEWEAEGAR